MFENIMENVQNKSPLLHSITNYVTVNDCANAVLAVGGSPIMADDIAEVAEITSICNALVINIGTLNNRTVESMIEAGKMANTLNIPVLLDPVGAGASAFRTETVFRLLQKIKFSVIRGNISEIKTIALGKGTTKGVDADSVDETALEQTDDIVAFAKKLSSEYDAIIAITGKTDIVSDANKTYIIKNGHSLMRKITGTGCMLSCIIGAYIGANPNAILDATAAAVCVMGISGEMAYRDGIGTLSLRQGIIDQLSLMTASTLNGGMKIEVQ